MIEKTLKSGAKLEMQLAEFQDAMNLLQVWQKNTKEAVQIFIATPEILTALWPCLDKCLWNKSRINAELFRDEKAREDLLEIAEEVAAFNLSPFMKHRARQ